MISIDQLLRIEQRLEDQSLVDLLRGDPTVMQLAIIVYCVDEDEQVDFGSWLKCQSGAHIMGRGMRLFAEIVQDTATAAGSDADFLPPTSSDGSGQEPEPSL